MATTPININLGFMNDLLGNSQKLAEVWEQISKTIADAGKAGQDLSRASAFSAVGDQSRGFATAHPMPFPTQNFGYSQPQHPFSNIGSGYNPQMLGFPPAGAPPRLEDMGVTMARTFGAPSYSVNEGIGTTSGSRNAFEKFQQAERDTQRLQQEMAKIGSGSDAEMKRKEIDAQLRQQKNAQDQAAYAMSREGEINRLKFLSPDEQIKAMKQEMRGGLPIISRQEQMEMSTYYDKGGASKDIENIEKLIGRKDKSGSVNDRQIADELRGIQGALKENQKDFALALDKYSAALEDNTKSDEDKEQAIQEAFKNLSLKTREGQELKDSANAARKADGDDDGASGGGWRGAVGRGAAIAATGLAAVSEVAKVGFDSYKRMEEQDIDSKRKIGALKGQFAGWQQSLLDKSLDIYNAESVFRTKGDVLYGKQNDETNFVGATGRQRAFENAKAEQIRELRLSDQENSSKLLGAAVGATQVGLGATAAVGTGGLLGIAGIGAAAHGVSGIARNLSTYNEGEFARLEGKTNVFGDITNRIIGRQPGESLVQNRKEVAALQTGAGMLSKGQQYEDNQVAQSGRQIMGLQERLNNIQGAQQFYSSRGSSTFNMESPEMRRQNAERYRSVFGVTDVNNVMQSPTDSGYAQLGETEYTKLGYSATQYQAMRNQLGGFIGAGQKGATDRQMSTVMGLSRSGLGDFGQIAGTLGQLNTVTGDTTNNDQKLKQILAEGVAAGFNKSELSQKWTSAVLGMGKQFGITETGGMAAQMSLAAALQSTTGKANELSLEQAQKGMAAYESFTGGGQGPMGAVKTMAIYGSGMTVATGASQMQGLGAQRIQSMLDQLKSGKITDRTLKDQISLSGGDKNKVREALESTLKAERSIFQGVGAQMGVDISDEALQKILAMPEGKEKQDAMDAFAAKSRNVSYNTGIGEEAGTADFVSRLQDFGKTGQMSKSAINKELERQKGKMDPGEQRKFAVKNAMATLSQMQTGGTMSPDEIAGAMATSGQTVDINGQQVAWSEISRDMQKDPNSKYRGVVSKLQKEGKIDTLAASRQMASDIAGPEGLQNVFISGIDSKTIKQIVDEIKKPGPTSAGSAQADPLSLDAKVGNRPSAGKINK